MSVSQSVFVYFLLICMSLNCQRWFMTMYVPGPGLSHRMSWLSMTVIRDSGDLSPHSAAEWEPTTSWSSWLPSLVLVSNKKQSHLSIPLFLAQRAGIRGKILYCKLGLRVFMLLTTIRCCMSLWLDIATDTKQIGKSTLNFHMFFKW